MVEDLNLPRLMISVFHCTIYIYMVYVYMVIYIYTIYIYIAIVNSFQAAQSFCCSGMCVSSFKVACVFAGDTDTEQLPSSGGQLWVWRMRNGLRCSYMWGSVTLPMQTSQAVNCHCEFVSGRPILLLQWHVCFQFQSCLRFCR